MAIVLPDNLVTGGLSQEILTADRAIVTLGDLAPGHDVWANVTVTAHGTGKHNVVPYVVAGGLAYTGISSTAAESSPTAAFLPAFSVTLQAKPLSPALAYAPAAVVLLMGVGLFLGRRRLVK